MSIFAHMFFAMLLCLMKNKCIFLRKTGIVKIEVRMSTVERDAKQELAPLHKIGRFHWSAVLHFVFFCYLFFVIFW